MTKINEIYKCEICGNIVEMVDPGMGQMICCGKPMILMTEKEMAETGTEKHKPVVTISDGIQVNIGSVPHPMEEAHHIKWIEIIDNAGKVTRMFLKPGDKPEALFCEKEYSIARTYCNIHGLWVTKK
jgi:superoxide reductase